MLSWIGPTVPWVTFRAKAFSSSGDFQVTLYKQYREGRGSSSGDDDVTQIDDDDYQSYQAIEFNRGTTVITVFATFLVGTFYCVSGLSDQRKTNVEIFCGFFLLFVTVICWSGSGYWVNRMSRDFFKDRERQGVKFSDETYCSAGCAIQLTNSFITFFLGGLMLLVAIAFPPGAKEDDEGAENNDQNKKDGQDTKIQKIPSAPPTTTKADEEA